MGHGPVVCKVCGGALEREDVRQLALYYHADQPSMVAVQYRCPRCGEVEWRRYDSRQWPARALPEGCRWNRLVAELGLQPEPARVACAERPPPAGAPVISDDEYIDFCCRVSCLSARDLAGLQTVSGER